MGTTPEDKDKQKRTYLLNRNDAEKLAEEKRISEAREKAESDRRLAEERFGNQRQQREEELKKSMAQKLSLDMKKTQDTKRVQDESLLHDEMNVVYSPERAKLKPKPGKKLYPEPEAIKKFRESLEDPEMKKSVIFDESTGTLLFSGPKGLDALEQYLDQSPNAKFGLQCDKNSLKSSLLELKNRGLLDKLTSLDVDGELVQGDDLKRQIQKSLNWPPKPTPDGIS